jgi:pantoate--beta-alanine ligase
VKRFDSVDDVRALIAEWREAGGTVALAPTMGNLHKGHMSLVARAAGEADHVVVSVFVNPTQFGPNEDYEDYPRTLDVDARRLSRAGVDLLFAPSVETMYPDGVDVATTVNVPGLSDVLEGEPRPGHFEGVTSVVCRLFNICSPDVAVFGQKDYQQFVILRRMVADLQLPVRLVAGPTEREKNGLAMSSRNGYLDKDQQEMATAIYKSLQQAQTELLDGARAYTELEQFAEERITAAGLGPEYVAIREAEDFSMPGSSSTDLVVLAAARLGTVRLIDNLTVKL